MVVALINTGKPNSELQRLCFMLAVICIQYNSSNNTITVYTNMFYINISHVTKINTLRTHQSQYVKTNKKASDGKTISVNYGASKHVIDVQSGQNSQFVIGIRMKWRRHVEFE